MKDPLDRSDQQDSLTLYTYEPQIEILTLKDERLKAMGEALSNDTSRMILVSILEGKTTAGEIASSLNLSLPLVVYHLERLLGSRLVRIADVKLTSKGRDRKIYRARNAAIVLQLDSNDPNVVLRLRRLFVASIFATAVGLGAVIWQETIPQDGIQMAISDSSDILSSLKLLVPIVVSCISGGVSVALAWAMRSLRSHK